MTIQKTPKRGTRKTEGRGEIPHVHPDNFWFGKGRGEISHVEYEAPRIGNRSDALDLLDKIIRESANRACYSDFIGTALETLRDAVEREILYPLRGA
jgi:hypothetical protein